MRTKRVNVRVPRREYTITIDEDAAITLRSMCDRVGGHPVTSYRAHVDLISESLREAGVPESDRFGGFAFQAGERIDLPLPSTPPAPPPRAHDPKGN